MEGWKGRRESVGEAKEEVNEAAMSTGLGDV